MFTLFLGGRKFQDPVSYFHNLICCVYRKTCENANYREKKSTFLSLPLKQHQHLHLPTKLSESSLGLLWRALFDHLSGAQRQKKTKQKNNQQIEKCFFKAAEEGFSTRPKTLAQMLVPIIPDQLLYSTCWPGVSYRFILFIFLHTRTK